MRRILIIGGGLAGFSAAVHLLKRGDQPIILEAAGHPGGRTFSFLYKPAQEIVDNGQHLLMGCYTDTLEYLDMIGSRDGLHEQKRLRVPVISQSKDRYLLSAPTLPYPLSLAAALLRYKALSFADRLRIIRFAAGLFFTNPHTLKDYSVEEWLDRKGQHPKIRKYIWDIIAVGALNCSTAEASASTLVLILKQMFFRGNYASTLLVPAVNLSDLFFENSARLLTESGAEIHLRERTSAIHINGKRVTSVRTTKSEHRDFDFVISAVPFHSLRHIQGYENMFEGDLPEVEERPILSCHLWLRNNPLKERMTALPDSPLQWVFHHGSYISTVISNAGVYKDMSGDERFEIITAELEKYFGIGRGDILHAKMIFEKRATFLPDKGMAFNRPGNRTPLKNLFLAGDWIGNEYPATIEAAVRSGKKAAELIAASKI